VTSRIAPPHDSSTWMSRLGYLLPSDRRAPRLPAAAIGVVDAAHTAGWKTSLSWGEDSMGEPSLVAEIGLDEPFHHYRLCWHSRGQLDPAAPGQEFTRDVSAARLRLFSKLFISAGGAAQDVSSLKVIRQAIADHPARAVVAESRRTERTNASCM
jgi:hypothetical protein